jgi:hypothetical protein
LEINAGVNLSATVAVEVAVPEYTIFVGDAVIASKQRLSIFSTAQSLIAIRVSSGIEYIARWSDIRAS